MRLQLCCKIDFGLPELVVARRSNKVNGGEARRLHGNPHHQKRMHIEGPQEIAIIFAAHQFRLWQRMFVVEGPRTPADRVPSQPKELIAPPAYGIARRKVPE